MPAFAIFTVSIVSSLIGAGIAWVFFRLKNQHLVSEARAESGRDLVAMEERLKAAENLNIGFRRELEKAEQIREELESRKIQLEKNISMLENVFELVSKLGFHPHKSKCMIQISRKEEVFKFLDLIEFRKY